MSSWVYQCHLCRQMFKKMIWECNLIEKQNCQEILERSFKNCNTWWTAKQSYTLQNTFQAHMLQFDIFMYFSLYLLLKDISIFSLNIKAFFNYENVTLMCECLVILSFGRKCCRYVFAQICSKWKKLKIGFISYHYRQLNRKYIYSK